MVGVGGGCDFFPIAARTEYLHINYFSWPGSFVVVEDRDGLWGRGFASLSFLFSALLYLLLITD